MAIFKEEKIMKSKQLHNRIFAAAAAVALTLSMTACKSNTPTASTTAAPATTAETTTAAPETTQAPEGIYKAGTYTASAPGLKGDVTVEVTFTADALEKVEITDHQETPGIGTNAVDKLPDEIVKTQSLGVDAVAGATITSDAILAAVADCVAQAGGDAEALKAVKAETTTEKTVENLSADLVIIGGGAAGMTACMRAEELDLSVILVEKMPFMGGAISISGGNQVVMGSDLQKNAGVTDDSVQSMYEDFMKNGADLNVPELLTLYAEHVGETSDWLQAQGVTFDTEGGLHQLAEYSHDRELAYTGSGAGAAEAMRQAIAATDATVLLETRAAELLTDENGAVTGVKASSDSTDYTIEAKAVLIATGGYGNNKELLTEEMQQALYYGPVSSTGDGVIMATAEGIDADTRLMEYGKRYPNGIEVSQGIAKSTIGGNITGWTMSAILVNSQGQRVVNEKASNRTILETELKQEGQMLYLLMDEETFSVWKTKLGGAGISQEDIDGYLKLNGSAAPVFIHGDSLEEVAETAGMDPDTLKATVDTYNGYVQSGKDEEFGRPADFMTMEIGDGPYYLVEQKPRFATTMGGLVVNDLLEVQNTSAKTITGLYAAGEVIGGVMGDDSPSGANNGLAVTSGKLAAEQIAKTLQP